MRAVTTGLAVGSRLLIPVALFCLLFHIFTAISWYFSVYFPSGSPQKLSIMEDRMVSEQAKLLFYVLATFSLEISTLFVLFFVTAGTTIIGSHRTIKWWKKRQKCRSNTRFGVASNFGTKSKGIIIMPSVTFMSAETSIISCS